MTCVYCEEDTAPRGFYVTYGGVIFCDFECLANWYIESDSDKSPREISKQAKIIEQ